MKKRLGATAFFFAVSCVAFGQAGLFSLPTGDSATSKLCEKLGTERGAISPAGPWTSIEEALSHAREAIGKEVAKNPSIEYECTIVRQANGYRITNPTKGTAKRSEHCYSGDTVAGIHFHPGGMTEQGQASMTDLITSNSHNMPEYILVETYGKTTDGEGNLLSESSKTLSPYIIELKPSGQYDILKEEHGKIGPATDADFIKYLMAIRCKGSKQEQIAELIKSIQACGDDLCKILNTQKMRKEFGGSPACEMPDGRGLSPETFAFQGKLGNLGIASQIKDSAADKHYCLSFEFVREQKTMGNKIYKCSECGKETLVAAKHGETIEDVIADNKRRAEFDKSRIDMLQAAGIEDNAGNINSTVGGVADEEMLKILTENGPASAGIILSTMQNQ